METTRDKEKRVARELEGLLRMRGRRGFLTYREAEAIREAVELLDSRGQEVKEKGEK